MSQKNTKPSRKSITIFLQAIDQNYQNFKTEEEIFDTQFDLYDLIENGDLKLNLDFIEFSEEKLNYKKSQHKNSEGSLSNSSESTDSTDIDGFCFGNCYCEGKILNESEKKSENKTNLKIKDVLKVRFQEDENTLMKEEILNLKRNLKRNIIGQILSKSEKESKRVFSQISKIPFPNKTNFNNFHQQQMQYQSPQIQTNFNSNLFYGNKTILGFFQMQQIKQNLLIESSLFGRQYQPANQQNIFNFIQRKDF